MILTAEHPVTNLYLVEVSGWDDNKAFFVENSELEWTEESGKQVTLNRGLNEDAVISFFACSSSWATTVRIQWPTKPISWRVIPKASGNSG
jgi:hypothetical protein